MLSQPQAPRLKPVMTLLPAVKARGPSTASLAASMLVVAAKFVQELNWVCCRFPNFPPRRFAALLPLQSLALALREAQKLQLATLHPGALQFVAANPIPPSIDGK